MEVNGKIKVIGNTQEVSASFKKRELVVTTDEQYPQHILIEFAQDKCDLLNSYKVGQEVKVSINLRGREWTNPQGEVKYFNQIQGWRIEKVESSENTNDTATFATAEKLQTPPDDLPF
jgi:translation initiation factor IF-3